VKDARAEEGGAGNGEDPGEDDTTRYAPADGREAASSADADNGAGDGVRGADRDAEFCGGKERDGAGVSAAKPPKGLSLVMRWPMVLMMRQPPAMVPPAIAKWQQMMTNRGPLRRTSAGRRSPRLQ